MARSAKRPGEVFASRVREVREGRRWSQQDLIDRLGELGLRMDRSALARIEGGRRGVSLDEALTIAAALGAGPSYLFFPLDDNEPIELAPNLSVLAQPARRWLRGSGPLREEDERTYFSEVSQAEFRAHTVTSLGQIVQAMDRLTDAWANGDEEAAVRAVESMSTLGAEVIQRLRAMHPWKGGPLVTRSGSLKEEG
jgi:transcriptional regulator with XRE-family HTH domain